MQRHVRKSARGRLTAIGHWLWQRRWAVGLVVWYSAMWSWSLFTDSVELAGSKKQGLLLAGVVVIINIALSVTVMRYATRLVQYIQRKQRPALFVVAAVPLFALADFLVAWLVALFWIGAQGNIDNVLPMSSPALLLMGTPLRFASRLIGLYGLAGCIWLATYFLLQTKHWRRALYPVGVVAVLSLVGWVAFRPVGGQIVRATLVSEALGDRVEAINADAVDVVVLPEYSLEGIENDNINTRVFQTAAAQKLAYFIGSSMEFKPLTTGHINRMHLGTTKQGFTEYQDKYRLIPGGEDIPYVLGFTLRALRQQSTINYFYYARSVLRSDKQLEPFVLGNIKVGSAVCSSIISPEDYRYFARRGAELFTNSASLATFGGSRLFAWQQENLATFMATANARPFLQSANAASAYAIDSNGSEIGKVQGLATLQASVRTNSRKTIYTLVGEWLVYMGAVICACLALAVLLRRLRRRRLA